MPGPPPKDPKLRQRRNKASTAATLPSEEEIANRRLRAPPLPRDRNWHKLTRSWWRDIWRSPMMPEFLRADTHALYRLARLIDEFWDDPNPRLAGEIRQEQACFGLTPLDRRRLEWQVEQTEDAKERGKKRRDKPEHQPGIQSDPRQLLKVVS